MDLSARLQVSAAAQPWTVASAPPSLFLCFLYLGQTPSTGLTALLARWYAALHVRFLEPFLLAHDTRWMCVSCLLAHRWPS